MVFIRSRDEEAMEFMKRHRALKIQILDHPFLKFSIEHARILLASVRDTAPTLSHQTPSCKIFYFCILFVISASLFPETLRSKLDYPMQ